MTADIRTAAEREAEKRWGKPDPAVIHPSAFDQLDTRMRNEFVAGYLAGAARVTPTREQLAERMQAHHFEECVYDGGVRTDTWFAKCSCGWESPESAYPSDAHDAFYVHASEQIAALMAGLAEWDCG